jgi:hypothetical protein
MKARTCRQEVTVIRDVMPSILLIVTIISDEPVTSIFRVEELEAADSSEKLETVVRLHGVYP